MTDLTLPADLLATLPEILLFIGPDGCVEYVSPNWEIVTGYRVAETIGRPALSFVDARDHAAMAAVFARVWEQEAQQLRYQARVAARHGRETWLEGRVRLATRADGTRVLAGLLRDVTSEVGGASVALGLWDLRFILDALPGMSFVTDESGQLVHLSTAAQRMFGADLVGKSGEHWQRLLHPDDAGETAARAHEWQASRVPFAASLRLRSLDGVWRSVQVLGVPRFADDGTFLGHLGFVQDETAAREAEAKVAEQNAMFASLLDVMAVAVFVDDADGTLLMANRRGRELADRFKGRTLAEVARAGDVQFLRDDGSVMPEAEWPFLLVRASGVPLQQQVLGMRHRDGEEFWYVVDFQMLPSAIGPWPEGSVMSSWEDITPIREAAKELRQANEALARSARMKDEFMASMSHELRTPLNAVLGLSEAMLDQVFGPVTERQVEALRDVALSGRHLLDLINDILDLSKVAAGKMEPDYDWADVGETCKAVVRMVQPTALAKRQQFSMQVSGGAAVRFTDARWLRQIITNLLSNAVKFTPEQGAVSLRVSLGARDVTLVVSDNGPGIDFGEQQRVFEPFVQLKQGLNRPQGGTGLGLALVRALTERLGGRVTLESAPGLGSTFSVWLPLEPEPGDETVPVTALRRDTGPRELPRVASGRQLLLAEDSEANIRTFVAYLQAKGYRVDVARNGELALEMIASKSYELVLMDVQMPVMDGLTATAQLRANPATAALPIVAITAFAMPGDRERCLAAGANEHIAKPVRLRKLVETIEAICGAAAG